MTRTTAERWYQRLTLGPACVALLSCAYILIFVATSASALSPSEQAAKSMRPPTAAERELHAQGCKFPPKSTGRIELAPGVFAEIIETGQIQILTTLKSVSSGDGKNAYFAALPFLPNGGIAGKDFCGVVGETHLAPPKRNGATISTIALRLRSNLDLPAEYPNTFKTIDRGDYLTTFPAGRYYMLNMSQKRMADWFEAFGTDWAMQHSSQPSVLKIDEYILIRQNQLFHPR